MLSRVHNQLKTKSDGWNPIPFVPKAIKNVTGQKMGKRAVSIVPSGKFPVKIGAFLFSVIIVFFHSTPHVCPYNDGKNYLFSTFLSNIGIAGNSNDYY